VSAYAAAVLAAEVAELGESPPLVAA
jgi:hypothetical protein